MEMTRNDPRIELVGRSYDAMGERFAEWRDQIVGDPRRAWAAELGTRDLESWVGDFLGASTFFSSFPPETNTRLVRQAGFEILRDEVVTFSEPDGDATFQWILARR